VLHKKDRHQTVHLSKRLMQPTPDNDNMKNFTNVKEDTKV